MNFEKRSRREMLQLIGFSALPLLASTPFMFTRKPREDGPLPFDGGVLKKWLRLCPEIAILGNSMVYCRLHQRRLATLWQPIRAMPLTLGGSRSLQWLLWLKNVAAACVPPPRLVVIFYRDYDFNHVGLHIDGTHLEAIRRTMVPGDEPFLRMARGDAKEENFRGWVENHFYDHPKNAHFRRKVSDTAYDAAAIVGRTTDKELERYVAETFELDQLRSDAVDAGAILNDNVDLADTIFTADPDVNYLQSFVDIADAKGIKLLFYRVKRRPNENNVTEQTDQLKTYTAAFKAWAEAAGHLLVDETDDPRITLQMFRDGDHFHQEYYDAYGQLFAERLRPYLPAKFTLEEIEEARRKAKATEGGSAQ